MISEEGQGAATTRQGQLAHDVEIELTVITTVVEISDLEEEPTVQSLSRLDLDFSKSPAIVFVSVFGVKRSKRVSIHPLAFHRTAFYSQLINIGEDFVSIVSVRNAVDGNVGHVMLNNVIGKTGGPTVYITERENIKQAVVRPCDRGCHDGHSLCGWY